MIKKTPYDIALAKRGRCKGKTKSGSRCKKSAIIGGYCTTHWPPKKDGEDRSCTDIEKGKQMVKR